MFGQTRKATPTNMERSMLAALANNPSCTLRLRRVKSGTCYCLYTANNSPLAQWPRGVLDGLILKTYIDYTPETGVFIIL